MRQLRVARRYAQALIGLADEQGQLERVSEDLLMLRRTLRESHEFVVFLKSLVVKTEKKQRVLEELFADKVHPSTQGFLRLLAEKGREDVLGQIVEEFFQLRDVMLGIVNVDVKAAVELTGDQNKALVKKFEGVTKKTVRVSISLDTTLRGGFIARVGDTVFDGSVRRQLELLRERFTRGAGMN